MTTNQTNYYMNSKERSERYEGDYQCETHEGYEASDRCQRVASQVRREPYTPGRFKAMFCDEHADSTYTFDAEATAKLRQDIERERAAQLEDDCRMVDKWIVCVLCDGKTTILREVTGNKSKYHVIEIEVECPNCGGRGETSIEVCAACGECEDECKCLEVTCES